MPDELSPAPLPHQQTWTACQVCVIGRPHFDMNVAELQGRMNSYVARLPRWKPISPGLEKFKAKKSLEVGCPQGPQPTPNVPRRTAFGSMITTIRTARNGEKTSRNVSREGMNELRMHGRKKEPRQSVIPGMEKPPILTPMITTSACAMVSFASQPQAAVDSQSQTRPPVLSHPSSKSTPSSEISLSELFLNVQ